MKKLKLEYLSPYLPYNLRLIFEKSGRIINMQSCFNEGDLHITDCGEGNDYNLKLWEFKPILRPLSDLVEEINADNDNKTFAPNIYLLENRECEAEYEFIEALYDDMRTVEDKMRFAPYSIFIQLVKWHFDVFGLIPKGLAFNINDLEK